MNTRLPLTLPAKLSIAALCLLALLRDRGASAGVTACAFVAHGLLAWLLAQVLA